MKPIYLAMYYNHLPLAAAFILSPFGVPMAEATEVSSENRAFGKPVSAEISAAPLESRDGLGLQIKTQVFSKKSRTLVDMSSQTSELLEGETRFYWNGIQVSGGKGEWQNGSYRYSIGIPPARLRLPLVKVPVGPIEIAVDAGVLGEASLSCALTPELGYPLEMLSVSGKVDANATAGAFLEGYAKFAVVRGGIGGELDLIDGNAGIEARVYAKGRPPEVKPHGWVKFLSGKFYAFLDYYQILRFRWKRVLQPTFKEWSGQCRIFGEGSAPCETPVSSPSSVSLD